MSRSDAAFGKAVRDACERNGFKSTRQFQQRTGFNYAVLSKMRNGIVPSVATVVRWAVAVGEPVNKWLRLAGYDLSLSATESGLESPVQSFQPEKVESPVPANTAPSVSIPEALHTAVATAPTREAKVQIVYEWLYLRGADIGVDSFGARDGGSVEARIAVIRGVEAALNVRLLPPDVV